MSKNYVGDIGTVITVDCGIDISDATTTELKVQKPDGTLVTWSASVANNNFLKSVITDGDFDQAGFYALHSSVVTPDWSGVGDVVYFKVYDLYT